MSDRVYCTIQDVINDLGLQGDDNGDLLERFIRPASDWIDRKIGMFIPYTEERSYNGNSYQNLDIDPLLAVTSLTEDGDTVTAGTSSGNYKLYPLERHWQNGPYTRALFVDRNWSVDEANVVITGRWGLYEETSAIGVSVTQTDSATNLVSTDGSAISPGMVLLIGTEQELVTGYSDPTAATSLVDGAIAATDDTITVDNGDEFAAGETIQIGVEDIYIHKINTDTLYVRRGWNGTSKAAHSNDSAINVYRTFTVKRGVNGTTAAAHDTAAVSRYVVPWDISYLCRQIAGLMKKKSDGGFAGKTGNAEMGEVFYHQEFPKEVYREVMSNYRIISV